MAIKISSPVDFFFFIIVKGLFVIALGFAVAFVLKIFRNSKKPKKPMEQQGKETDDRLTTHERRDLFLKNLQMQLMTSFGPLKGMQVFEFFTEVTVYTKGKYLVTLLSLHDSFNSSIKGGTWSTKQLLQTFLKMQENEKIPQDMKTIIVRHSTVLRSIVTRNHEESA